MTIRSLMFVDASVSTNSSAFAGLVSFLSANFLPFASAGFISFPSAGFVPFPSTYPLMPVV